MFRFPKPTSSVGGTPHAHHNCRWLPALLLALSPAADAVPIHKDYAVIFSGGFDAANNHLRYYEETLRMWNITIDTLGFDKDKVYVLFADGVDPAKDRTEGEEKTKDPAEQVNSDWGAVTGAGGIVRSATSADLQNTMNEVARRITQDDSFYFWAFNHGYNAAYPKCPNANSLAPNDDNSGIANTVNPDVCDPPAGPNPNTSDVSLVTWQGTITDANFAGLATLIAAKNPKGEAYAFAECFSEGMVDNLFPAPHRFAAWAASQDECSLGKAWANAWANGLEMGMTSTFELGLFAAFTDPKCCGPGKKKETPGFMGGDFDIIT